MNQIKTIIEILNESRKNTNESNGPTISLADVKSVVTAPGSTEPKLFDFIVSNVKKSGSSSELSYNDVIKAIDDWTDTLKFFNTNLETKLVRMKAALYKKLKAVTEESKPRNLSLDDALNQIMRKHKLDYDEDGEIYSMTDSADTVAKYVRSGLSKYAAVRDGSFRMAGKDIKLKIGGKNSPSQTITVFPDGSSKQ